MAFNLTDAVNQEVVTQKLIIRLRRNLVAGVAMRYHQVPAGVDSYKIPGFLDVIEQDYTGTDLTIDPADMEHKILLLSNKKAFAKSVDYVDDYESAIEILGRVLDEGVYTIQKVTDAFILETIASTSGVPTIGDIDLTKDNVIRTILNMGQTLDENDVPEFGRFLIVNPAMSSLLAEANLLFNTSTAEEGAVRGFIGTFGGFNIYKSNNLPASATAGYTDVVAGVADGGDFGQSIYVDEIVKNPKSFQYIIKGLSSYGAVVSKPEAYVLASVQVV
jgi:hypothetical protein